MIEGKDNLYINLNNVVLAEKINSIYRLTLDSGKQIFVNAEIFETVKEYEPISNKDLQAVIEVAEGKTKSYIISYADNPDFNSQNNLLLDTSGTITTTSGDTVNISDLNVGDVILVIELEVPDRWVGDASGAKTNFYKLETTKVDLSTKQDTLVIGENVTINTETLTFTYDDDTTGTLTVVTGITFNE